MTQRGTYTTDNLLSELLVSAFFNCLFTAGQGWLRCVSVIWWISLS